MATGGILQDGGGCVATRLYYGGAHFGDCHDMVAKAEISKMNGIAGAVRSGIALYKMNSTVTNGGSGAYPPSLDAGNVCFGVVVDADFNESPPVFSCGPPLPPLVYRYTHGGVSANWVYDPSSGTFNCVSGSCSN